MQSPWVGEWLSSAFLVEDQCVVVNERVNVNQSYCCCCCFVVVKKKREEKKQNLLKE